MQNKLLWLFLLSLMLSACGSQEKGNQQDFDCSFSGFANKQIEAQVSDNLFITLKNPLDCTTHFLLQSGLSYSKYFKFNKGEKSLRLGKIDLAGSYVLKPLHQADKDLYLNIKVKADAPQSIEHYVGPKKQSYYSDHQIESFYLIEDQFQNLVVLQEAINERIQFDTKTSNRSNESEQDYYGHLFHNLNDRDAYISLNYEHLKSKRKYVESETGCPVYAEINIDESLSYADSDQLIHITLNNIKDIEKKNIVNGTAIDLLVENLDGKILSRHQSYAIANGCQYIIESPSLGGNYRFRAVACGSTISEKSLKILSPSIEPESYYWKDGALILADIYVNSSYELPDGKMVNLSISGCGSTQELQATKTDGTIKLQKNIAPFKACSNLIIKLKDIR